MNSITNPIKVSAVDAIDLVGDLPTPIAEFYAGTNVPLVYEMAIAYLGFCDEVAAFQSAF